MALFVKTYSELAGMALKLGRSREYGLWLLLRFLDASGKARVDLAELRKLIAEHRLFRWGGKPMSEARLQDWVRRGDGIFWQIAGDQVFYRSLRRVCIALDVRPAREPVAIPLREFATLARFRAHLYGSWLGENRTMSRATISDLLGITRETQNQYDALVRTEKQENAAFAKCKSGKEAERLLKWLNRGKANGRAWLSTDRLTVFVGMPSTLSARLPKLPRGQIRRVRRSLHGVGDVATPTVALRYAESSEQARQAQKRGRLDAEYMVQTPLVRGKHRLWRYGQNAPAFV